MHLTPKTRLSPAFMLPILLCCSSSCSIKEDRADCPLIYNLTIMGNHSSSREMTIGIWQDDAVLENQEIPASNTETTVEYLIPKGAFTVSIVSGVERCSVDDGKILVTNGKDSDRIYAWYRETASHEDFLRDTATLHKQFANFTFMTGGEAEFDKVTIESRTSGMDLRSLEPVEGIFKCSASTASSRQVSFILPRQKDQGKDLTLHLRTHDGTEFLLDIGGMIMEAGYNWDDTDLKDIVLSSEGQGFVLTITPCEPWMESPVIIERI